MTDSESISGHFRSDECKLNLHIYKDGRSSKDYDDDFVDAIEIHGHWEKEENSDPLTIQVSWHAVTGSGLEDDIDPPQVQNMQFSDDLKYVSIGTCKCIRQD